LNWWGASHAAGAPLFFAQRIPQPARQLPRVRHTLLALLPFGAAHQPVFNRTLATVLHQPRLPAMIGGAPAAGLHLRFDCLAIFSAWNFFRPLPPRRVVSPLQLEIRYRNQGCPAPPVTRSCKEE